MIRIEGWESRLHALVEDARRRPYELGTHDCMQFALAGVQALTGRDLAAELAPLTPDGKGIGPGSYLTERQAYTLMRAVAKARGLEVQGHPLPAVVTAVLGPPVTMPRVHRGDVVLYDDPSGPHLGLCLGSQVAVLAVAGLIFPTRAQCVQGWSV
jgi:hypothetical protein